MKTKFLFSAFFSIFVVLLASLLIFGGKAEATSWDPGRIIDDGKFTNKNSMSIQDIQNFLTSKVPVCDTWHAPGSGAQGANPPWYCLKEYVENGKGAPQIIWEAAQAYGINPQVLIVTLQKENGLVTDTWPYPWQYRTAMGFACPDNGTCDPAYYGFTNQVHQAARHFRNFYDGRRDGNFWTPKALGSNNILWSPNSACGYSNVNIVTRGTVALYSYTPYQPNAAALNNLYGYGDGCSAYGNRNFWRDFNNWFGSTLDAPYNWQWTGQGAYSDSARTQPINLSALNPGQTVYLRVTGTNTGNSTWQKTGNNPVRLGTWNPTDRSSSFVAGWLSPNRATVINENSVAYGQTGTFDFAITVPANMGQGTYREYFNPVAEGYSWFNDWGVYFDIGVKQGYKLSFAGQSAYPSAQAGQSANGWIQYKNEGSLPWYDDDSVGTATPGTKPLHLATNNPLNRASIFGNSWGAGKNRPSTNFAVVYLANGTTLAPDQNIVQPGQIVRFNIPFSVPSGTSGGTYHEYFIPILEGGSALNDVGTYLDVIVSTPPPVPGQNQFIEVLNTGQSLATNQVLISPDGRYKLIMQGDGNLVLYSPNRPLWWTGTWNKPINLFAVQTDSNLVLYDAVSKYYWASWTHGRGGTKLVMQNDGNLVLYTASGVPVWYTNTAGKI